MPDKIKVLVVDESVVYRHFFMEAFKELPGIDEVVVAATNRIALARLKQAPADLIVFDLQMNEREALETIKAIRTIAPDAGLLAMYSQDSTNAEIAVRALELGALEILTKPDPAGGPAAMAEMQARVEPVLRAFAGKKHVRLARRLAEGRLIRPDRGSAAPTVSGPEKRTVSTTPRAMTTTTAPLPIKRIEVVAIGVSTGGPNALAEVIPKLPGDLGVPVLLVQHMPPHFTAALAESLNRRSAIEVNEAIHGQEIRPNHVYIAPGGKHMLVVNGPAGSTPTARIVLNQDPPVNSCRPAADVLFNSVAEVFGGAVLAVIMTGMGNDGAEGIRAVKNRGAYCLSQSEETCVVYGMPRAVDEAGLSDEQVPLDQLAARIQALVRRKAGVSS